VSDLTTDRRESAAAIRRGATRLAHRLRSERSSSTLSGNKLLVLGRLHRDGSLSPSQVAAAEHQQLQSLTRVLRELTEARLVAKRRNPDDGREWLLTITAAGRTALAADMAERDHWLAGALDTLSETEVGVLRLAADIMERVADAAG
jgi:DNA-binding MarR family transcriptional regulator